MATVQEHYAHVLSDVYSWMYGGLENGIEKNAIFFKEQGIHPIRSGIAIDLGAGCGFQSIPLAQIGFSVTALDIDKQLLGELTNHSGGLKVETIQDDLMNFDRYVTNQVELIVCMTDTLLHLESKEKVISLFKKIFLALEKNGKFILTFRDLSCELSELDRFIPVKSDTNTILTCFLEYEPETVKVHDLVHKKNNDHWQLNKSYYRKLRLSKAWVDTQLSNTGFATIESTIHHGLVTVIATR